MKLISLNIQNNLHNEIILEFLKKEKPDVVCMQELLEEDFDYFKKGLGFDGAFCLWRYIEHHSFLGMIGKIEGVAIFSKNILNFGEVFYKGKKENISKYSFEEYISDETLKKNSAFVWLEVKDKDNKIFKFVTTHFPITKVGKPFPYVEGDSTPDQLEVCDAFLDKVASIGEFVACGDFNAPRGKETFSRIGRKYKDNIPEEYKTSIDQNLHRVKGLQLMVDGLFTTPSYKASNVKLVDGVSDHMAIVAEVTKN